METPEEKISRVRKIPSLIGWARQNFRRSDKTRDSLMRLAETKIQISLNSVYGLCRKRVYRELTEDEAWDRALAFSGFPGKAARSILPVFEEYIRERQIEAPEEFRDFAAPFPIGRDESGSPIVIPVKPTFISIQEGELRPVFLVGWVDSPLDFHQRRLIAAIVRRSILSQQDFLGSDADIVTFVRKKFSQDRQLGVWKVLDMPDYSDSELVDQFNIYTKALRDVVAFLKDSGAGA